MYKATFTKTKYKWNIKKEGTFIYKKNKYYMTIRYHYGNNTTHISIWLTHNDILGIRKSHFIYHTKCLNVQQHINNFIIELKEKGI